MIGCDLVRAVLVALMALPGTPLPLLAGLLVLAQLAEAPFGAAQGALLPTVLGEQRYERGQRVMLITHQAGQLVGFAGGGVLVVWLGSHLSLGVNAVTFLLSATLVRFGVKARPAAGADERKPRLGAQVGSAAALIWSDRRLRSLVALGWLAGFVVLPEGLAAPSRTRSAGAPPRWDSCSPRIRREWCWVRLFWGGLGSGTSGGAACSGRWRSARICRCSSTGSVPA